MRDKIKKFLKNYDSLSSIDGILCGILIFAILRSPWSYIATVGVLVTIVFGVVSIGSSAIYVYDRVTTPSENTKTTDIYRITKENNYLTFSAKKPYNHLYRTKTMEITYANSGEYVIVTDNQAYRIPKESVSE